MIETIYSWRNLGDAYFLVKVAGWILLSWGAMHIRAGHALRLGSVEILFAGSCFAVCLTGLILTLVKANRH